MARKLSRVLVAAFGAVTLVATVFTVGVAAPQAATAVVGSDFNAGYIISDAVFTNTSTMSAGQVQTFLEQMEPSCAAANGMPCLKNYSQATFSRDAAPSGQCGAYTGQTSETAAQIIYNVGKTCNVNPQVLLVLLQKEEGLVTASSPSAGAYRIATGYGCPDTAPCDSQYFGFYNQVYKAAWQFREYMIHESSWRYHTGAVAVQYSPNASCGSSVVNILNAGTAALYNYTPYQPNAAALANLSGAGDGCSSYGNRNFWVYFNNWFGSSIGFDNPVANLEVFADELGKLHVKGWAFDPNSKDSIQVHVYIDGVGTPLIAGISRPDVAAVYGDIGTNHGFDATLPLTVAASHQICVYGINVGAGINTTILCTTLTGSPVGSVDKLTASNGQIVAGGWTLDPDVADPIATHMYVDGAGTAYVANTSRGDIAAAYPGYGASHGYSIGQPAAAGSHSVCLYGINVASGGNSTIGCGTVAVPNALPTGSFDVATAGVKQISVGGWAIDPNSTSSIAVHVYVDSVGYPHTANSSRPDVGAAFPAYGSLHGYQATVPAAAGTHNVCAYAIDSDSSGQNTTLGCKTVTVLGGSPVGSFDSLTAVGGTVIGAGWVIDPDVAGTVSVQFAVDSGAVGSAYPAALSRPDVGAAYPAYGALHGYSQQLALSAGTHRVCAYGVNVDTGSDTLLGCRSVTV